MLTIDLTIRPDNPIYAGLGVTEVGGRGNLPDAMIPATLNAIGKAVHELVERHPDRDEITLTGPAPIQAYLVAFHVVVHRFRVVHYAGGRGEVAVISQHG